MAPEVSAPIGACYRGLSSVAGVAVGVASRARGLDISCYREFHVCWPPILGRYPLRRACNTAVAPRYPAWDGCYQPAGRRYREAERVAGACYRPASPRAPAGGEKRR